MKNAKKVLLLALCAILLVGATIAGTVAYLTSQKTVTNTFTVGKVSITLTEKEIDPQTGKKLTNAADVTELQKIELVPSRIIEKNPVITVSDDSEECYLFVKIENALLTVGTINGLTGWESVSGDANTNSVSIYRYNTTVNAGAVIPVFDTFTCDSDITEYEASMDGKQIVITAYAIQAEGLTAEQAAEALGLN
jgi:predicted ribosomally synthesized peptide with SipW-like signal peptide